MSTTDMKETNFVDNLQEIDVDWFCRTQQWIKKQDFVAYGKKKYFIPHLLFIHPVYFLEFDVNKILFQFKSNKISEDWQMEQAFVESFDQEDGEDQDEAEDQDVLESFDQEDGQDQDEAEDHNDEEIVILHEKPGSDLMQEPSESDIEFLYEIRTVTVITL